MNWQIIYYNKQIEEDILTFPDGILARYLRLADLMIEFGPNLGLPHTKVIDKKLYELRVEGGEGIARIFYCTKIKNKIVILHSFIKKSQKIPKKELDKAKKRLKEVLNNDSF